MKKKIGVSNTPYDGGRWVTDGGWWVTDGGWWVTNGGWWVTDGGWWVTDGGWWVTDGGWWVTDGGWWVATKHQRVDAIVKKRGGGVLMAPPDPKMGCGSLNRGNPRLPRSICRLARRISRLPLGIVQWTTSSNRGLGCPSATNGCSRRSKSDKWPHAGARHQQPTEGQDVHWGVPHVTQTAKCVPTGRTRGTRGGGGHLLCPRIVMAKSV